MTKIQSLTERRIIIPAQLNGKDANFLIDTGATAALVSESIKRKYGLSVGRRFHRPLVGAGGEFRAYYCNTPAMLAGKTLTQFLLADISAVAESIKQETGIVIHGIISLPQMQFVGMRIDTRDNTIILD